MRSTTVGPVRVIVVNNSTRFAATSSTASTSYIDCSRLTQEKSNNRPHDGDDEDVDLQVKFVCGGKILARIIDDFTRAARGNELNNHCPGGTAGRRSLVAGVAEEIDPRRPAAGRARRYHTPCGAGRVGAPPRTARARQESMPSKSEQEGARHHAARQWLFLHVLVVALVGCSLPLFAAPLVASGHGYWLLASSVPHDTQQTAAGPGRIDRCAPRI